MLSFKPVEKLLLLAVVLIVSGCLIPSDKIPFTWLEPYSLELMWALLSAGFLFFFFNRSRSAFIAFGGCALICYFLNERTGDCIKAYEKEKMENAPSLRAGIFSLSGSPESHPDSLLDVISRTGADILTLQDVPAAQSTEIKRYLIRAGYEFIRTVPFRDGQKELMVCSKYPVDFAQVVSGRITPVMFGRIRLRDGDSLLNLHIVSTVFPVELPGEQTASLAGQLARQLEGITEPNLILCELNLLPWSRHLQEFKAISSVEDSRRGVRPASAQGNLTIFERPTDHIFFSRHFKCVSFETISYGASAHIGIVGTFQLMHKVHDGNALRTSSEELSVRY